MRTTITLDPDTKALLDRFMRERGLGFKDAVNEVIREALARRRPAKPVRTPSHALGLPAVNLDRALSLAGELEDEELVRKARMGK